MPGTSDGVNRAAFLDAVRSRAARIASGGSAMRGIENTGASKAARAALREISLDAFGTRNQDRFRENLDAATESVLVRLPKGAKRWGLARKVVNIYLRDCLYTTYLAPLYSLELAEEFYEVPLDRYVADGIRASRGALTAPEWDSIKALTREDSARFQELAAIEARRRGIARVHLDAFWWSLERD